MILRFVFFGSSKTDEAEVLVLLLLSEFLVFVVLVDDELLDILGLLVLGRGGGGEGEKKIHMKPQIQYGYVEGGRRSLSTLVGNCEK